MGEGSGGEERKGGKEQGRGGEGGKGGDHKGWFTPDVRYPEKYPAPTFVSL